MKDEFINLMMETGYSLLEAEEAWAIFESEYREWTKSLPNGEAEESE